MGIGGQGISAVAQMALEARGNNVVITGCDMQASATTRAFYAAFLDAFEHFVLGMDMDIPTWYCRIVRWMRGNDYDI
jgi:nitrogenase subunit NifH